MSDNKPSAPLPRDFDKASFSEIMPFRSKKIRLMKSPVLYLVAFAAVVNVVMFVKFNTFTSTDDAKLKYSTFVFYEQLSVFYLALLTLLIIHLYSRTDKSFLFYVFPWAFIFAFMSIGLFNYIYTPFALLAGAEIRDQNLGPWQRIWAAFAGPGLREEFVKALPLLICAWMTLRAASFKSLPRWLYNLMRIRTPLDGVLMGSASGAAFLCFETGTQYVIETAEQAFKTGGNLGAAYGEGFMLLVPRVVNGLVGHMAWASIVGYFIGLAVIRPKNGIILILVGYVIASALHGLWDSVARAELWYVIGGLSGFLSIACLVKARQLEAALFGRATGTFGSIIVGAPGAPAYQAAAFKAPQAFGQAGAPTASPFQPVAAAPIATRPAAASSGLVLTIDSLQLPLRNGEIVDLGAQPALNGRGQGTRGEVTQHPTKPDVIGLKNLGSNTWYAKLRDGSIQPVESQRNLRLAAGISVDFGSGVVAQIVSG